MSEDLDLAGPLRAAVLDNAEIVALLGLWEAEPSVHTRRPIPSTAGSPLIIVNPDVAVGDADYLNSPMPIVTRDLAVYGDQPAHYRAVETVGYKLRALFHNNRFAISVPGFHVIDIRATGPMPAPTDDEKRVGRIVSLRIQLQQLSG